MNTSSWTRENIAWAAGLFEGEGSITLVGGRYVRLQLSSTDEDVVRKLRDVIGGSVYGPRVNTGGLGKKPFWMWVVYGFEKGQAVLAAFWAFLGSRRRARIEEALRIARDSALAARPMGKRTHCSKGHEYSEANTYKYQGIRLCRACLAAKSRRFRARKSAERSL